MTYDIECDCGGLLLYSEEGKRVVMQYTGLKDCEGKEIYEGDILRTFDFSLPADPVSIQAVKYLPHLGSFVLYTSTDSETEWDEMIYQCVTTKQGDLGFHEVIGNIYENPELLDNA